MAGNNHGRDLALKKEIGVRMRKVRRNSNLTIKTVGLNLGIYSTSVTCWKTEEKFPSVEHLDAILSLNRVSADDLLARTSAEKFQKELLLLGARRMDRRQRRALVQETLVQDLH